jgi:ABC-2 type transport system permease protein
MTATNALAGASVRSYTRDKTSLFFTFAFPLVFLALFGALFHAQSVDGDGRPYITHIASGVLSWGVANAALFGAAFTVMQWRRDDVLRLIRLTPTRLGSVLAARFLVALAICATQVVIFVATASLPAFGLRLDHTWPLAVPVLAAGVTAFLVLGVIVGTYADSPEAVAGICNVVMVPMAFLSGSFFPLASMPGYLQHVSRVLPLRYLNDGVLAAVSGQDAARSALVGCAVLGAFAVPAAVVALRIFRWST